jgi:uncharacterized protein (DUF849 family)
MMVALPAATAVTTPLDDTVASCGAALLHVMARPESTLFDASRSTADACVVCPAFSDCAPNVTLTLATGAGGGASTPIAALADLPSTVALIMVLPCDTAVTRPAFDTVATVGFDDDHVGTRDVRTLPAASYAVAESCDDPLTCSVAEFGVTVIDAAVTAVTEKFAVPAMPSATALIVADPAPTAVTRPAAFTVATAGALELHVNVRPDIGAPCASNATAESCAV